MLQNGLPGENPERTPYLAIAPQIKCFEHQHRLLVILVFLIVPAYLMVLIPYAVVEGDCSYVSTEKVWVGIHQSWKVVSSYARTGRSPFESWDEHYWVRSARRKATVLDKGFLHPNPQTVFTNLTVELFSKAFLPVITIETTRHPGWQVCLVLLVGFIMCYTSLAHP